MWTLPALTNGLVQIMSPRQTLVGGWTGEDPDQQSFKTVLLFSTQIKPLQNWFKFTLE